MTAPMIKLYSRAMCGWCQDAKAWLDSHGFDYELIDVGIDTEARDEMVRISGQHRVPTISANGEVLGDFDTGQLEKFFKQLGFLD